MAIGANQNVAGSVRIFEHIGGSWSQIGQDIDGESLYDEMVIHVSLSSDGSKVAIGSSNLEMVDLMLVMYVFLSILGLVVSNRQDIDIEGDAAMARFTIDGVG